MFVDINYWDKLYFCKCEIKRLIIGIFVYVWRFDKLDFYNSLKFDWKIKGF